MEKKKELLKDLIEISDLTQQEKLNTIMQTLQKTDDIMRAKMLSSKIITGDFSGVKEKAIQNLVDSFSKLNGMELEDNDTGKDNRTQNLEYELKTLRLEMESVEYNSKKKLEELEQKYKDMEELNKKLASKLLVTTHSELIEVSDEDINELYIKYLGSGDTVHNDAFILNDIIPKTYYKIDNIGGYKKC
jgi:hypothetical protein